MTRRFLFRTLFYIVLISLAAFYLLPIYLMLLTSFKPFDQVDLKTMWSLPTTGLHIANFIAGYKQLALISITA